VGSSETSYVYKYGRGYNWFVNEGILELKKLLLVYPQSDVILNFGVNDLGNISKYIQIYQELINTYPKAHFYVMAVNPVDDVKYPSLVQRNKTTKLVTIFNSILKSAFPDCYIDTYSYLESSGYETLDGCHYTTATCLKIYHYTLSEIQKNSILIYVLDEKNNIFDHQNIYVNYYIRNVSLYEDLYQAFLKSKDFLLKKINTISLKSGKINYHIIKNNILYIESFRNYIVIHTSISDYTLRYTLKKIHKKLGNEFVRLAHAEGVFRTQDVLISEEKL
ncbi:LytTR family transcriptional regulator DNA-binding domain-containing protein, partial [uncultured Haemophilus sp.]|uniref:LytTR family transcriptional regulator DNA-binding domain-containing protein n=1 Tax=uncultured Haemophilus sp. TaxID=237779 RepID=UPI0027DD0188